MAVQSLALCAEPTIGSVEDARAHVVSRALSPSPVGRVGLELEFHLVDRRVPARRLSWPKIQALLADLPTMPGGSRLTVEPGTQLELSTPPTADMVSAVAVLRSDRQALVEALAGVGLGLASIGADPARPVRRCNQQSSRRGPLAVLVEETHA